MASDTRNGASGGGGAEGASGAARLSAPPDGTRAPRLPFPVVGIGASAGGLEAYTEFLQACPADAGMAYVLVQHLPPDRESLLVEILSRQTRMPVVEVTDGQAVEPDRVYVIRPGHTLTIRDGRLRLGVELAARGHGRPVDDLFRSLAEEQQQRAVAVVFSGMGSNGTAGAQAVRAVGGLVIAQEPETAKFPAMPRSLIDAHLPDYILRPSEVPAALARYARQPYAADDHAAAAVSPADEPRLADVLAVLRTRTRHDFAGYRKPTLLRRVRRRMGLGQYATVGDYVTALRQTPGEVTALADDLLIHVTGFFRDPEAWAALREKVINPLAGGRADGAEVRCWVSACATGEEAYTLAMLLTEAAEERGKRFDVKVFATDMAERALGAARAGVFANGIESEVTPERLARFFDKDDNFYRVKRDLREQVIFAPQNVLQDPPFSRLDIATCRNLLIYLEPETQKRLLSLLHFGLREGGALMLGSSESLAPADGDFEPIDKKHRIFRRVGPTRAGTLELPALPAAARLAALAVGAPPAPAATGQLVSRALLDRHTPAAVAVDAAGHVVHVHGDTARFLTFPAGAPTLDLLSLANEQVRGAVRTALQRAADAQASVTVRDGLIETPGGRRRVEVAAAPLGPRGVAPLYLVTFRDYPEPAPTPPDGDPSAAGQLADDLRRARDELQGALEEMQSSNEELKASHEEATSLNEELQSTNEELETSKEEMQSLNEELVTVNAQLQAKMTELEATANDLGSLLTSTDIAVLFLDTKFRIRRFTPATKDLFDLISSDVGRPLADLRRKFADSDLLADAQRVLDKLVPVERPVESESGRHYLRRVLPYRTQDDRISGAVVVFVDITERRKAEAALVVSEAKYRTLFESLDEGFCLIEIRFDESGKAYDYVFLETNAAFERQSGLVGAVGRSVLELVPGIEAHWVELYGRVAKTGEPIRFEAHVAAMDRVFDIYALSGGGNKVAAVFNDITERKRRESDLAFLDEVSADLVGLTSLGVTMGVLGAKIGAHFRATRVAFFEFDEAAEGAVCEYDWHAKADDPSFAGEYRTADFYTDPKDFASTLRAGKAYVLGDGTADERVVPESLVALGIRSFVVVPTDQDPGTPLVVLALNDDKPRAWRGDEIALIREVTTRIWTRVERARAEAALRASEGRLRAVAANLPGGAAFVVGPDLRYTLAEGHGLRDAGFAPADFEGKTLAEALPPDQAAQYELYYRRALAGEPFRLEHASHGRQYVTHGQPLRDDAGRVTAALAVSYDITGLRRAEERLRLALAAARMGIWTLDGSTGAHTRDANLNVLLGLDARETTQPFEDFLTHIHPDDAPGVGAAFAASRREGRPLNVEFRVALPGGAVRWLRDQGDVFGDAAAGARPMAGACVDVTALKEAEAALRDARDRLEVRVAERTAELEQAMDALEAEMGRRRDLTRRLSTAQEDERRRVARDLHDTVGQLTAGLALAFKSIETGGALPPAEAAKLAAAQRVLGELGREVHGLAVRLRPTSLDDLGLEAAVGQLAAEWSTWSGVRADFLAAGVEPGRLPDEVETAVYRVVQEALTNVAKHADAKAVSVVVVTRSDGSVSVVVEDDGAGFDPDATPGGRLGLLGMRERVELVGGTIDIESRPGAGTTVAAQIPVPKGVSP